MTSSTVSILSTQVKGNYEYCAHDFEHICLQLHHYLTIITCTARLGGRREGEGSDLRLLQRRVGGEERRWEEEEERQSGRQGAYLQWEVQSLQRQSNLTLLRTNARDQQTAMLSVQADELTAEADKPRV